MEYSLIQKVVPHEILGLNEQFLVDYWLHVVSEGNILGDKDILNI